MTLKDNIQWITLCVLSLKSHKFDIYYIKRRLIKCGYKIVYKQLPSRFVFNPFVSNNFRSDCGRYAYVSICDAMKTDKYRHGWCVELDKNIPEALTKTINHR